MSDFWPTHYDPKFIGEGDEAAFRERVAAEYGMEVSEIDTVVRTNVQDDIVALRSMTDEQIIRHWDREIIPNGWPKYYLNGGGITGLVLPQNAWFNDGRGSPQQRGVPTIKGAQLIRLLAENFDAVRAGAA